MQPLPTPYDITEIPVFAWSPGSHLWIMLLAFVLLGILFLWATWMRTNAKESASEVLSQALLAWSGLETSLAKEAPKFVIARASSILRRFLSTKIDPSVASMGPAQLIQFANVRVQASEKSLIQLLANLEEFKFSPGDSKEIAKNLIAQGSHELKQLNEGIKTQL